MSTGKGTDERAQRPPLGARAPEMAPRATRLVTLLFGALLALTLTLAPRAEAYVYWPNFRDGTIGRANLDGTGVNQRFIRLPRPSDLRGVAVDDAHVYWTNAESGTIGRANLDGTGVNPSFISGVGFPFGVAVDASHVYWGAAPERIGRANLDGSGVDHSFIVPPDSEDDRTIGAVAVDAAYVYWANSNYLSDVLPPRSDTIGRANLDGTGLNPGFIPTLSDPGGLAVDDAHVYWGNNSETTVPVGYKPILRGKIGRANLDGTGVNQRFILLEKFVSANLGSEPSGLAVHDAHLYWTDSIKYTIGRANMDGTNVDNDLITGATQPYSVAVDALRSFSLGKVKKNKKKGIAKLTVKVPGPGTLKLAKTKSVKGARTFADVRGKAKLPIKPRREAKNRLKRNGKANVTVEVTYTPRGGDPTIVGNTDTRTVRLVKRG